MSKDLESSPLHPDLFLSLGNEFVVDDSTSSGKVSQLNNEVVVDVEAVCGQLAVHDKPVSRQAACAITDGTVLFAILNDMKVIYCGASFKLKYTA